MLESLKPGIEHQFRFRVPPSKTVPQLYPEASELQMMPQVFATRFLVGLIEWTCIQAINPHLAWPEEQSVGIDINISHPPALGQHTVDGHCPITKYTKTGSIITPSMMQSSGKAEGHIHLILQQQLGGNRLEVQLVEAHRVLRAHAVLQHQP